LDSRGGKILTRAGKRVERGTTPPPCHACPKKSPEEAKLYELSERNIKVYEMYLKSQATGGMCLGELARDEETQRDFAIIHQIVTSIRDSRMEMALMKAGVKGLM
jgi:hypothetical protein